jgi:FtsZ-binding cell division protein ZapB
MTGDQKTRYETMKQMSIEELDHLDQELREEVARARLKIEELQKTKKVVKQIHDNACSLLGVKSVVELAPAPDKSLIEVKDNGQGDGDSNASSAQSNW